MPKTFGRYLDLMMSNPKAKKYGVQNISRSPCPKLLFNLRKIIAMALSCSGVNAFKYSARLKTNKAPKLLNALTTAMATLIMTEDKKTLAHALFTLLKRRYTVSPKK